MSETKPISLFQPVEGGPIYEVKDARARQDVAAEHEIGEELRAKINAIEEAETVQEAEIAELKGDMAQQAFKSSSMMIAMRAIVDCLENVAYTSANGSQLIQAVKDAINRVPVVDDGIYQSGEVVFIPTTSNVPVEFTAGVLKFA